jgi:hypothetical protein
MVARSRHLALVVWLWHTSLGFLSYPADHRPDIASLMTEHVIEIGDRSRFAERKLAGSGWTFRDNLVLWLCLLCSLVSTTEGLDILTTRLAKAADKLNVRDEEELERALKGHPPSTKFLASVSGTRIY